MMLRDNCPTYDWCDTDHSNELASPEFHEQHVTIRVDNLEQDFTLSLDDGCPRIYTAVESGEVWLEPGEQTNDFQSVAKIWLLANERYEKFAREHTPTLRRHRSVTEQFVEVEG